MGERDLASSQSSIHTQVDFRRYSTHHDVCGLDTPLGNVGSNKPRHSALTQMDVEAVKSTLHQVSMAKITYSAGAGSVISLTDDIVPLLLLYRCMNARDKL